MPGQSNRYATRKLRSSYISTIVSISLVLLMLGLLGLILIHARKISNHVKENIELSIFLDEAARIADIEQFQKKLDASRYVKTTEYVTKEEAARRLKKDLGEDFVSFLGYNPLLPSINIRLYADYANSDSLAWIEKQLVKNPLTKEVSYQKSLVNLVNENLRTIALVLFTFTGLLAVIAIALINNTIRLSLYSKRFLIKSMQLVGATRSFIRRPFIKNGILNGIYGGIIANLLLVGIIYLSQREIPDIIELQQDVEVFALLFLGIIVTGVVISWISTLFAVSKYLRSKLDELYY
jgi:cell division transport system permease protein